MVYGISGPFEPLSLSQRQITYALLTLSPLSSAAEATDSRTTCMPNPRR